MSDIKIIFFDIDGTLVDPATGRVPETATLALQKLRQKGILLCIATGRAPCSLPDFGGFRFDAYCTFNGALCRTEDVTIFQNPLSCEAVDKIIENAAALGRPVSLALEDRLSANGLDRDLADYYTLADLILTVDENFDAARQENVYQIMLGCREEDFPAIIRDVPGVKLAVSWDRAVDVISATGGKGTGIRKIMEFYGLQPAQSLAFGDSYNDLELLQAAGTGVAMGNAAQALKDIADDICRSVSDDGIYRYCIEQGLIDV